jgi:Protein of unknown function (DUF3631)
MNAEELLANNGIKLDSTAPGRYYTTCPKCSATRSRAHQGSKVLGVTIGDDGSVHFGCSHCSWTGPEKGSGKGRNGRGGEGFAATYDYTDAAGALLFQKVRNAPGGKLRFWLRRPDGKGSWINNTKGINTGILYHAPDVARAITEGRIVAVVEGEKDANSVRALGIVATCNAHGASELGKRPKWTRAHSEQLRGADIVVLNDNDGAGYAHADATCNLSLGIAKRVRRLDLAKHWPEIQQGGDVSDWLAAGHTGEELEALIASAPDYAPTEQAKESRSEEQESSATDVEITRLAKLSTVEYEHQRKGAAEKLDMRASILDKLVAAERAELGLDADDGKQGHAIAFPDPEPWPDPVAGAALLDDLAAAIRKHVVLPDHARDACALWAVHTYLADRFLISPRLGVRSPTKGCGKTLLLDVLDRVVARPLPTANVTAAAIFRVIEAHQPTLLVDEADTFLYDNDELRGVLNSGHRKGGAVLRTVGDDHEPRSFATYAPCVIALIGALPDTLHDRAVIVDLKRRLPSEKVEPFRPDRAGHLDVLARKAARWTHDHADAIAAADPAMPIGIVNREADNWRPLLAIASVVGGKWFNQACEAAQAAHIAAADDAESRLELLLGDIRDAFADKAEMPSADLVKALIDLEGRPWAELGKSRKPLTQNGLARRLKPLGIAPENIRVGDKVPKGYVLARFEEAFSRYLPDGQASKPLHRYKADEMGISEPFQTATNQSDVADRKCEKSNNGGQCSVVADEKPLQPDEPGLSRRRVRDLAEQYQERAYANAQENDGDTRTAELDAWLRQRLASEGVLPEFIEAEFGRVMVEVFRV